MSRVIILGATGSLGRHVLHEALIACAARPFLPRGPAPAAPPSARSCASRRAGRSPPADPSHSSGETPKYLPRRSAVSAVIERFPPTMSLTRLGRHRRISRASALMLTSERLHELLKEDFPGVRSDRAVWPPCASPTSGNRRFRRRTRVPPARRNPIAPLVVDADAVLALAVALQRFQPVARRREQVLERPRLAQVQQLAPRRPLDRPAAARSAGRSNSASASADRKDLITRQGYYAARNTSSELLRPPFQHPYQIVEIVRP